jgi:hypothetical protein
VASQLSPIVGEGEGLYLGSAEVDADTQGQPPEVRGGRES